MEKNTQHIATNMQLDGKKILVVGFGKSGQESSKMATRLGAKSIVYDDNNKIEVCEFVNKSYTKEDLDKIDWDEIDLVILSPGVPTEHDVVLLAKENDKEVIGEVEFGYRLSRGNFLGITGTNGKTTTTSLLGQILKKVTPDSFTVGNIGIPLTAVSDKTSDNSQIAIELSSYHLENIKEFKPEVCAILNITPDHLERHKTMENYIACKFAIAKNLWKDNYLILNADDKNIMGYYENHKLPEAVSMVFFSATRTLKQLRSQLDKVAHQRLEKFKDGTYENDIKHDFELEKYVLNYGIMCLDDEKENIQYVHVNLVEAKTSVETICPVSLIQIPGVHNIENILAASACAYCMKVDPKIIKSAIKEFTGVEHRIEFVKEVNGVSYYNDSKATNPDSTIKAMEAMHNKNVPTILILGGYDKKISYEDIFTHLTPNIYQLILFGQIKDILKQEANKVGFRKFNVVDTLDQAITIASIDSVKGDCVLFSPGTSSFDQFKSFEHRGEVFKELVNKLEENEVDL